MRPAFSQPVEFTGDTIGKELPVNAGDIRDVGLISEWGKSPGEKAMATHCSLLAWRIPWRGAWWATVHGVAKSQK